MRAIDGTNTTGLDVQDLDYDWDTIGNLTVRNELSGPKNLSETFEYDGLNRLITQDVTEFGTSIVNPIESPPIF